MEAQAVDMDPCVPAGFPAEMHLMTVKRCTVLVLDVPGRGPDVMAPEEVLKQPPAFGQPGPQ